MIALDAKREVSAPADNAKAPSRAEDTKDSRARSKSAESPHAVDHNRERDAQRNQLADTLGALLKHKLDEGVQPDQPRKRMRPQMRPKVRKTHGCFLHPPADIAGQKAGR